MITDRVLYAPNIHQGGGKSLLLPLLEILQGERGITFILDERLQLPENISLSGVIYRVTPSIVSRLWIEWRLRYILSDEARLLSITNLPPLFAHQGEQLVFIQNRYLVDPAPPLAPLPWNVRTRIAIERWWLRSRAKYVSEFIVQTPSMASLIKQTLRNTVKVLPFISSDSLVARENFRAHQCRFDFLYIASGEPHKNHMTLVDGWIELSKLGSFPTLALTLDRKHFPELCQWIEDKIQAHALRIVLLGELSRSEIQHLYMDSKALIYPSMYESFGLPLIEATQLGLSVLASNLPYVMDVIRPSGLFDPTSSRSIADAVRRFTYVPSTLKTNLFSPEEFLEQTLRLSE